MCAPRNDRRSGNQSRRSPPFGEDDDDDDDDDDEETTTTNERLSALGRVSSVRIGTGKSGSIGRIHHCRRGVVTIPPVVSEVTEGVPHLSLETQGVRPNLWWQQHQQQQQQQCPRNPLSSDGVVLFANVWCLDPTKRFVLRSYATTNN